MRRHMVCSSWIHTSHAFLGYSHPLNNNINCTTHAQTSDSLVPGSNCCITSKNLRRKTQKVIFFKICKQSVHCWTTGINVFQDITKPKISNAQRYFKSKRRIGHSVIIFWKQTGRGTTYLRPHLHQHI